MEEDNKGSRNRRITWQREWLSRREEKGAYSTLLSELKLEDQGSYLNFLRLSPGIFHDLLEKVTPYIEKQDTVFRRSISPGLRLAITLRYLATGESFISLSYLFRVGNNTIGCIVPETCEAIHRVLAKDYFQCPRTEVEWEAVAREYQQKWNFPNCIGSLDGKHVQIRQPSCSGAKFFNYKHSFSIILLALVDASYKFLFIDVGAQGRCSDGGVFSDSNLNQAILDHSINIPAPTPLPGKSEPYPYCIIADDAFPLKDFLMKPFPQRNLTHPQRIFNYRLSRARRCVENAFGIMANRFRVLLNPICVGPDKVDKIVFACCSLHNMLRNLAPNQYNCDAEVTRMPENHIRRTSADIQLAAAKVSSRRSSTNMGKKYREYLMEYFSSPEGSVAWQESMI